MLDELKRWRGAVQLFCGIVFRPVTVPVPGEAWPWRRHLSCRLGPVAAWQVARILHPTRRQEAVERAKIHRIVADVETHFEPAQRDAAAVLGDWSAG